MNILLILRTKFVLDKFLQSRIKSASTRYLAAFFCNINRDPKSKKMFIPKANNQHFYNNISIYILRSPLKWPAWEPDLAESD